jgi:hypothetical protein
MANTKFLKPVPNFTLRVTNVSATGKDLYNLEDGSGLSGIYRTYNVTINCTTLLTGDDNIGSYTGRDIRPGDFYSLTNGNKVWKIISVSSKSSNSITGVVEDINMGIARTQDNNNNNPNDTGGVVFRVNDNNYPLINQTYQDSLSGRTLDKISSYLQSFNNFNLFTFQPTITGSLELGDLVTITGSGTGYNLITASLGDTTIGTVFDVYGENVIVRPYNKIITDFEEASKLQGGIVGSIWYESGSGQITTSSADNRSQKFLQLSLPESAITTGTVDNPTFDETSYDFYINEVEVIARNPGGSSALTIGDITQSINTYTDQHHVVAGINQEGGTISVSSEDSAGTGGETGVIRFKSNYGIIEFMGGPGDPIGDYSSTATGTFSITSSNGYEIEVKPTYASATVTAANYPVATEEDITNAINAAATAAGASISATYGTDTITITETNGGDLEINKGETQNVVVTSGIHLVGDDSSTGLPTGEFQAPPPEYYLSLTRQDGGRIMLSGSFIGTGQSLGLNNTVGTPPYLLMLEGGSLTASGSGVDDDWYIGDTFLTASKDVQITGSLLVNRQDSTADFFLIRSGSYDALKVDSQGITRFFAHEDETNPWATADYGGLYYMSSSVWVAID